MNTIGINNNLDRARIKKLLAIGLFASILTGAGDFLLGFGEEVRGASISSQVMANALNLSDGQLIWGGLLGMVGLFLEWLAFFAIYRLMADASPKYAHIYRAGIFGYIWLAPIGCHMNVGVLNIAYKYLSWSRSCACGSSWKQAALSVQLARLGTVHGVLAADACYSVQSLCQRAHAVSRLCKMVQSVYRDDSGADHSVHSRNRHKARSRNRNHVLKLRQCFYLRWIALCDAE